MPKTNNDVLAENLIMRIEEIRRHEKRIATFLDSSEVSKLLKKLKRIEASINKGKNSDDFDAIRLKQQNEIERIFKELLNQEREHIQQNEKLSKIMETHASNVLAAQSLQRSPDIAGNSQTAAIAEALCQFMLTITYDDSGLTVEQIIADYEKKLLIARKARDTIDKILGGRKEVPLSVINNILASLKNPQRASARSSSAPPAPQRRDSARLSQVGRAANTILSQSAPADPVKATKPKKHRHKTR